MVFALSTSSVLLYPVCATCPTRGLIPPREPSAIVPPHLLPFKPYAVCKYLNIVGKTTPIVIAPPQPFRLLLMVRRLPLKRSFMAHLLALERFSPPLPPWGRRKPLLPDFLRFRPQSLEVPIQVTPRLASPFTAKMLRLLFLILVPSLHSFDASP